MSSDTGTVASLFARAASIYADHPFLCVLPEVAVAYDIEPGEITYAQAAGWAADLTASYRRAGYGYGQRVGVLVENRPDFFVHWFALNTLGVSVVPINPDLRLVELAYLINHSELVAIVAIEGRHEALEQAAASAGCRIVLFAPDTDPLPCFVPVAATRLPDMTSEAALLYTSGTTGRPKGCVLSNRYFLAAGAWYAALGGLAALQPGTERMLTPLPLFHMNAMAYSAMAMVKVGGCLIVLDRFHPRAWWTSVRQARATVIHYLGVMPPMLMSAAESLEDRSHAVRFGFGAGVDRLLHAAFEQRFGFPLIEAWAMTETGAGAVVAASGEPRHVGTSCFGRPDEAVDVQIVTEDGQQAGIDVAGELLVRHAGTDPRYGFFDFYLKDNEATEAAWAGGWFHTGDVVRRGADGSLYFVDRRRNIIRRSGENISAVEVEGVLLQHPSVRQVAVAPVADAVRGDEVFACVVAEPVLPDRAGQVQLAGELVAFCLERLAYYKAPGFIAFVESVPLTTTQKIQRGQLPALVAAVLPGSVDTRALKKRVT